MRATAAKVPAGRPPVKPPDRRTAPGMVTRVAILADALEDAGCDDAEVLAHCRGDGPHVRGCWLIDMLLGKG